MKITYIELRGFIRFALSGINVFKMDISSFLQLILGTNGCGKSSLMEQLTPLPPASTDFIKNGGKIIHIEHADKLYVLSSLFGTPHPHSFLVDNIELNEGGTISVQRELVKTHFGLTQEIHELLVGVESFTEMSPSRRKEWFIRLCDTNYDFAISVYNKLKEQHRDVSGAIKLSRNALVQESSKLVGDDEINLIEERVKVIHEFLQALIEIRKPTDYDLDELSMENVSLDRELFKSAKLLDNLVTVTDNIILPESEIERQISFHHEEAIRYTTRLSEIEKRLKDANRKIDLLNSQNASSLASMVANFRNVEDLYAAKQKTRSVEFTHAIDDPPNALSYFINSKNRLGELFGDLPNNPNKAYSKANLDEALSKQQKIILDLEGLSTNLQRHQLVIEHQAQHKDQPSVTCPKCTFSFSALYNAAAERLAATSIKEIEETLKQKRSELEALNLFITRCQEYGSVFKFITHIFQGSDGLMPYYNWLVADGCFHENNASAIYKLSDIEKDLSLLCELLELNVSMTLQLRAINELEKLGPSNINELNQLKEELDNEIEEFAGSLIKHTQFKERLVSDQQAIRQRKSQHAMVLALIKKKKELSKQAFETQRRMILNSMIRSIQSELAQKESQIAQAKAQKGIVANIASRIDGLKTQESDLALLIKQLSPTEGLIAQGLLGFIKNFIDQLNDIISKIWSYRLEIMSCEIEDGETIDLDYKFPMMVHTSDKPVPDISKGSTGIEEIINLAYRLTAMQYLKMQNYPLYLDEAGRAFDVAHRAELGKMIRTIVEQSSFSQIYLISHYFELYGGLSNVETCVLSEMNISTPPVYNQHVMIS